MKNNIKKNGDLGWGGISTFWLQVSASGLVLG